VFLRRLEKTAAGPQCADLAIFVISVALATGCTFPVTLRHPETGAAVRCGPYYYTRTPAVATAAGAKEARCVEEYERQGYVRLRR
jgi:hypothetical protein